MSMLPIGDIIGILADNLRLRNSVMPLGRRAATGWARGLNIPRGGERILYTGHMYQMMPAVMGMQQQMALLKKTGLTGTIWMGRIINKFINTSAFMGIGAGGSRPAYDARLRNIARLLQAAGVSFGYLYEKELYAGALACDLGAKTAFEAHARRVAALLKARGVKSIITVDPHTTDMFREAYPKIVPDFNIEVKSYLEVLAEDTPELLTSLKREVAIHDSCVYARYVGVLEEPRRLLEAAGVTVLAPEQSRKQTQCCGGPLEALFSEKAEKFAAERLEQLKSTGCRQIVAMCPICLHNLESAAGNGATVRDISEHLAEAYCPVE